MSCHGHMTINFMTCDSHMVIRQISCDSHMVIRQMSCDSHMVHSPGEPNFNQACQSGKEAILQCQHYICE